MVDVGRVGAGNWNSSLSPESSLGEGDDSSSSQNSVMSNSADSYDLTDNPRASRRADDMAYDKASHSLPDSMLTSSERIAKQPTTAESLEEQPSQLTSLSPLAGPAGMAARREFGNVPVTQSGAYDSYKGLVADDFAGPGDIRLKQLSRSTESINSDLRTTLRDAMPQTADVTGRSKTPESTFGKLREPFDALTGRAPAIGDIKDLSGLRVSVSPTAPDFADVYGAQSQVQNVLGPDLTLKQDYIAQPNSWGYTGRVHSTLTEANGLTHEVQIGTKDVSNFIDSRLETVTGDITSLHDVTGYKGEVYGVKLPERLEADYARQIGQITETNRTGQNLADVPAVRQDVSRYLDDVQQSLPDKLNAAPTPDLSNRARVGNIGARGLGVLDIAGSALQVNQGVQLLRSGGDTIEGVADVGAGSTGVVSGVALAAGRIAVGTATGGVVAVLDGTKDIYVGVRDGNVEKTAVGTAKAGAGAAMLAGVVTANPILIAGGAIAYGGAAIYESRDAIASAAGSAWSWTKSWF